MAPDPENPQIPEFMPAPDTMEVIKEMTPKQAEIDIMKPYDTDADVGFEIAPNPLDIVYGEDFEVPKGPIEMIYGENAGGSSSSEDSPLMSAMGVPYGKPPMPILVTPDTGGAPVPMMVPVGGGPLVPYSLTGPGAPPPVPILVSGPSGQPKAMMIPPGGGPLVPY